MLRAFRDFGGLWVSLWGVLGFSRFLGCLGLAGALPRLLLGREALQSRGFCAAFMEVRPATLGFRARRAWGFRMWGFGFRAQGFWGFGVWGLGG